MSDQPSAKELDKRAKEMANPNPAPATPRPSDRTIASAAPETKSPAPPATLIGISASVPSLDDPDVTSRESDSQE